MTVEVIGVRQHLVDDEIVVLLLDPAAELFIPILIGPAEASAIATAQAGVVPRRPMTHDLLCDVIAAVGESLSQVEITSLDVGMQTAGPAGAPPVRQPVTGKVVPLGVIDMVVIPGLAFDRKGYRVGRGRGFYDRFLCQQDFQGARCALCFHEQLQEAGVPCEPHDIPMDLIVTDREVVRCHPGAKP